MKHWLVFFLALASVGSVKEQSYRDKRENLASFSNVTIYYNKHFQSQQWVASCFSLR